MIRETIVTTSNPDGAPHIAPMGIHIEGEALVFAPFKPSRTLENLLRLRRAVVNYTDDVRVFAGCLTGRYDWPVCAADQIEGIRLVDCLAHAEVEIIRCEDDPQRPRLWGRLVCERLHKPFHGFNRAQSAVIEAAILVSRLDRLPREKVDSELDYLSIAIHKTAGTRELEAWEWLMSRIANERHEASV